MGPCLPFWGSSELKLVTPLGLSQRHHTGTQHSKWHSGSAGDKHEKIHETLCSSAY